MSTSTMTGKRTTATAATRRPLTAGRVGLQVFLIVVSLLWLFPVLWAVINSFRDYAYTAQHGYVSFGGFT